MPPNVSWVHVAYITYYNEYRLHFSLDVDKYETPIEVLNKKKADKAIKKNDSKWIERESNE